MPDDVKTDDGLEEPHAQEPLGGDSSPDKSPDYIDRLKDKTSSGPRAKSGVTGQLSSATKAIGNFATQNKKPLIGGGGVVGIIIALVIGSSGFLGLFEAVHVAENVKQDVMKKLNHMEEHETQSIMQKIITKAIQSRGTPTADATNSDSIERNINETDAEGFKNDFKGNNINANFDSSSGTLISISDGSGTKSVDLKNPDATALSDISTSVPITEAEVNVDMTDLLDHQYGVGFDIFTGKDNQDMKKTAAKEVLEDNGTPTTTGDKTIDDVKTAALSGDMDKASSTAIKDVAGRIGPLTDNLEGVLAVIGCALQSIINDGFKNHYVATSKALMKTSGLLFSVSDQAKSGQNVSLKAYGSFISNNLNGNPNATNPEARLGFDQSAGWKQITGQPVTAKNPPITPAADPNTPPGVLTSSLQFLSGNIVTTSFCFLVLNPISQTIGAVLDEVSNAIVNLPDGETINVADLGSGIALKAAVISGTTVATTEASKNGAVAGVLNKISNIVLAAADLAVTGNDNAVQFLNNAKLGGDMSANTTARYLGGHRLSKTSALAMASEADNQQAAQLAKTSLWNQTMSLANVNSIASRFLIQIPLTKNTALASIFQIPKLPSIMMGDIQSAFGNKASAATGDFSDSQQFGLTDAELAQYDVIANSHYMTDPSQGISIPITATASVMVPRIYFLGDPSQYKPSQGDLQTCNTDISTCPTASYPGVPTAIAHNALLGCYVNAIEDPSKAATTVCGDMLDFRESDNPTNFTDSQFASIYCYGVASIGNNHCVAPTDSEDIRYGKFLLDYHLTNTLMQYANATAGYTPAPDDGAN
jgi:hypothetical protein